MAGAAVAGYRAFLRRLAARAAPAAAPAVPASGFSEAELGRYARHIMLREVGGTGQRRLKAARVLVVGAGGLGSPALLYLAAAGVGTIGVIDDDAVEGSNLQRQVIHTDARIGMPKVFSAEAAMRALNPFIAARPYHRRLTGDIAADLFADYDLILDGSDNFDTRTLVNRTAVRLGLPVVAGAITQWEGQVALWHPAAGGPCYECVFPVRPAPGMVPTCAEAGVIAALPGVIGAIMATEALKHLTGAGETLLGRLMIHDALMAETRVIRAARRADCACCGPAARANWTAAPAAP
jgi:molybdopterin/thiamine biosynthesis adenylyltransferase